MVSVGGETLREMEDCENTFAENLADGVEVEVEPYVVLHGPIPRGGLAPAVAAAGGWESLEGDLASFAEDYQVELIITTDRKEIQLRGPRCAVVGARLEALGLICAYFA